jgi:hypothetical protein
VNATAASKAPLPTAILPLPLDEVVAFELDAVCDPDPDPDAPSLDAVPVVFTPDEPPVEALVPVPVPEDCALVVVTEPLPSLSSPAVIVTGNLLSSVASYVVVLDPGKFACSPAALSAQTAPPAARRVHS